MHASSPVDVGHVDEHARIACGRRRTRTLAAAAAGLVALLTNAAWAAEGWRWSITPYIWLPTINGEFTFDVPPDDSGGDDGTSVDSEIGPSDYLTDLNGALMLTAEASRDGWTLAGDLVYLNISADRATVHTVSGGGDTISIPRETNLDTETDLKGAIVSFTAGHQWGGSERSPVAWLAGVRWLAIDADLGWELTTTITGPDVTLSSDGQASDSIDVYDAIVGVRGTWEIGDLGGWYVPWRLDAGAGSSDFTWQAVLGVGYAFDRSALLFVIRHLDYDSGDEDLLRELSLGGPAFGFTWRF
jgi:hypothetical protein